MMIPLTTMLLTIADGKGCGTRAFVSSLSGAVRRPLMWAPALSILISDCWSRMAGYEALMSKYPFHETKTIDHLLSGHVAAVREA